MESNTPRKKPKFLRTDTHKRMRLGKSVKSKRKWRAAKGRQNKIRLGRKGHSQRPKIGWGAPKETKNLVNGLIPINISSVKELTHIKKSQGIIIRKVGQKKRKEIIEKANEKGIKILNKYKIKSSQEK